jgi:hypothetical protein
MRYVTLMKICDLFALLYIVVPIQYEKQAGRTGYTGREAGRHGRRIADARSQDARSQKNELI